VRFSGTGAGDYALILRDTIRLLLLLNERSDWFREED